MAGLILALSVKTINFPDKVTENYQKNVTNRRGDMLFEAVTLHRRFPFAVLGGFLFLHAGAATDGTDKRNTTFLNAHDLFRLFTGRSDPAGREEQYERIYIGLYEDEPASVVLYEAGKPNSPITWEKAVSELLQMIADRNPDHYRFLEVPESELDGGAMLLESPSRYEGRVSGKAKRKSSATAGVSGPRWEAR